MSTSTESTPAPENLPHDSLESNIISSAAISWTVAFIFVALRFYTRTKIIQALNLSDWCILASVIFAGGTSAGKIEEAVHGAGRHVWDLDPNDIYNAIGWGKSVWYGILFYTLSLGFSKISILLLYHHIFAFQRVHLAIRIVLAIVIISIVYSVVIVFTACIPLHGYWDFTVTDKYCHPPTIWWANVGLFMATDFLIFLLPMPAVWTLNIPQRQKYALSGIFGLGFFVCVISIIRVPYLVRLQHPLPNADIFYDSVPLTHWTLIELNGAIVCACLMTLKPLVIKIFPRFFGTNLPSGDLVTSPTISSRPRKMSDSQTPTRSVDASLEEALETNKEAAGMRLDG